jgi:hypothetical protein
MGILPNFLIIGAAKSGTTSLYYHLKQHPDIYLSPIKETNFFALEGETLDFRGPFDHGKGCIGEFSITKYSDYIKLYSKATGYKAVGEASPLYLYHPKAPSNIKKYVPHAKLIAILRNPIERAYSSYLQFRRDGREPESDFFIALSKEEERIRDNWEHMWHYTKMGFYASQIKRYYNFFSKDQIKILLYDDFVDNTEGVVRDICAFIGVDPEVSINTSQRHNASAEPRREWLHKLMWAPPKTVRYSIGLLPEALKKPLRKPVFEFIYNKSGIPRQSKRYLKKIFQSEIHELSVLIGRDLRSWLK